MRVAMLLGSMSRTSGGVGVVAQELSSSLQKNCCDVVAFAGKDSYSEMDKKNWGSVVVHTFKTFRPYSFGYQIGLIDALKKFKPDLLHLHGLWMYSSLVNLIFSKRGIPTIVSPHGMLDEWALSNSKFKKLLVGVLYEKANLKASKCIHALTFSELKAIRACNIKTPICVIPNGITLPTESRDIPHPPWSSINSSKKIMLYLGRIHPKKGLVNLIQSWSRLDTNNWHLIIAGWDQDGHESELKLLRDSLGMQNSVTFIGPQFGDAKVTCFRNADAFILPSFSEGLPMVVLEAWSYKLPVLMTKECNLPEGFQTKSAIQVSHELGELPSQLKEFMSVSDKQMAKMGANGYNLVSTNFSWTTIAKKMTDVYDWVLSEGPKPDCVYLD